MSSLCPPSSRTKDVGSFSGPSGVSPLPNTHTTPSALERKISKIGSYQVLSWSRKGSVGVIPVVWKSEFSWYWNCPVDRSLTRLSTHYRRRDVWKSLHECVTGNDIRFEISMRGKRDKPVSLCLNPRRPFPETSTLIPMIIRLEFYPSAGSCRSTRATLVRLFLPPSQSTASSGSGTRRFALFLDYGGPTTRSWFLPWIPRLPLGSTVDRSNGCFLT